MAPREELRFSDFLKEDNILCNLPAMSRDEALSRLTELLVRNEGGVGKNEALAEVLEREKVSPTVIAPGIALPHARLDGLERPLVAVATSSKGIDFMAPGEEPVNVIILILTPRADPGVYLRLVAAVSKTLGAPRMRRRLAVGGTAKELFGLLSEGVTALPAYLTAKDVMDPNPVTLKEGDDLATAIEAFCTHSVSDIPIVDEEGDLRGVVSLHDVLRLSLPEHLLWMEDLSPILHFQPFTELLKRDRETKIADFMREDFVTIAADTPAIQLAKMFLRYGVWLIHVVDGMKLAGVVTQQSFVAQLFWA